jgi:hypothetical protein
MNRFALPCLLVSLLTGCFTSEEDLAKKQQECELTNTCDGPVVEETSISGTAATGQALIAATVTVTDVDGNNIIPIVRTDANGTYTLEFDGDIPVPLLITVLPSGGKVLQAILDDAQSSRINVNPITNYVTDKILATTDLASVTPGLMQSEGQATVDKLFGTGISFDAFAYNSFVARQTIADFSAEVSIADVMLDSLLDVAGDEDVDTLLANAESNDMALFQSPRYLAAFGKNLAKRAGTEFDLTSVIDSSRASEEVLAGIDSISSIAGMSEEVVTQIFQTGGINIVEALAAIDGLVTIIVELSTVEGQIDISKLEAVKTNVLVELVDDLVTLVSSKSLDELTSEQLVENANQIASQIVSLIQDKAIDMTQENVDLSSVDESIKLAVSLDSSSNWDQANWDEMVWK